MIEIINKPINDRFYNLVSNSKSTIKLCAPYVKKNIVNNIYDNIKGNNVKIEFISNFSMPNFYKRSSDIEAFKIAIEHQDKIYNCQTLHAKIYIFDEECSIITSSNLTLSGFKKNLEYGVFISDTNLVNRTVKDFRNICNDENTGKINSKKIMDIENMLRSFPEYKDIDLENHKDTEIDSLLDIDVDILKANLNNWQKLVLDVINLVEKCEFSLDDICNYKYVFSNAYPNNNTIRASIRRNLQELRDLGLIKFRGNGKYKKLWS
ncbi:phospholipase D-like domain-containing protein [Clostridium sp. LBM24168]